MQNAFPHIRNEKGSTLIAVVFFMAALTLMGTVLATLTGNSSKLVSIDIQSQKAFYVAQSAIEFGIKKSLNSTNWHWTSSNQPIAGGSATITVQDSTILPALKDTLQVKVTATASGAGSRQIYRVRYRDISSLAVYISGDLNGVTLNDSAGTPNSSLGVDYATELPEMDVNRMKQIAIAQGHYFSSSVSVSNGSSYPTGNDASFYHPRLNGTPSDTPNVVYVEGNLEVKNGGQVFGIIVVTGDVILKNSQKLEGILYLPSPVSVVQQVDLDNKESIYGGIIGGANVDGHGNASKINVYYRESYMKKFFSNYAVNGMPYVTFWRSWKQF